MSVNLKTACRDCVHEKVCRNVGRPEAFQMRLISISKGDLKYDSRRIKRRS